MDAVLVANEEAPRTSLPRSQSGSSTQHLLVTLVGDYWLDRPEHLPSAALVSLLEEFDVTAAAARSALSRLNRRGLLEATKEGRRTFYGLNPETAARIRAGNDRIMAFGAGETWDGLWRLVIYSLPEDQRDIRNHLRSRLQWIGFAPLFDGVYVSPSSAAALEAATLLAELEVGSATILRAVQEEDVASGRALIDAWDLAALARAYEDFTGECRRMLSLLERGDATPTQALRARTAVMDTYRTFPGLDPELPLELMPPDWPRAVARRAFVQLYDGLAPLAEIRVRQLIALHDRGLAELARCHVTSDSLP